MLFNKKFMLETLKADFTLYRSIRNNAEILRIWKKAKDLDDFCYQLKTNQNENIRFDKISIDLLWKIRKDWYYRRDFCGRYAKEHFETSSDVGSLLVVTDGDCCGYLYHNYTFFSQKGEKTEWKISNLYGDTYKNRVFVLDSKDDEKIDYFFNRYHSFVDITSAHIRIYDYDCEKNPENYVTELSGHYKIYVDDRFFVFVKIHDDKEIEK